MPDIRFTTPPGWDQPPEGYLPSAAWSPRPDWPPAPDGWTFYTDADGNPIEPPPGTWRPIATDSAAPEPELKLNVTRLVQLVVAAVVLLTALSLVIVFAVRRERVVTPEQFDTILADGTHVLNGTVQDHQLVSVADATGQGTGNTCADAFTQAIYAGASGVLMAGVPDGDSALQLTVIRHADRKATSAAYANALKGLPCEDAGMKVSAEASDDPRSALVTIDDGAVRWQVALAPHGNTMAMSSNDVASGITPADLSRLLRDQVRAAAKR